MNNRFSDRPLTLQERVWLYQAGNGNVEALAELMKARRVDASFDVMSLAGAELNAAYKECQEGMIAAAREEEEWQAMLVGK